MKVLVVIPAFNEEGKIGSTVKGIPKRVVDKILVIDDGSIDHTKEEAKRAGATVISKEKNMGVGAAIRTGIDYSIRNKYDITLIMAGDNQDKGSEIPKLLKKIEEGYDFVQGSRYLGKTESMPLFRLITTYMFSAFMSLVVGTGVTDASNGFRAFRNIVFDKIDIRNPELDRYELEPYLMIKAIKYRYKFTEVGVTKRYFKKLGFSKMVPFKDWYSITKPLLKEFFGL